MHSQSSAPNSPGFQQSNGDCEHVEMDHWSAAADLITYRGPYHLPMALSPTNGLITYRNVKSHAEADTPTSHPHAIMLSSQKVWRACCWLAGCHFLARNPIPRVQHSNNLLHHRFHSLLSLPPMLNPPLQQSAQLSQKLRNFLKRLTGNSESCRAEVLSQRRLYIKTLGLCQGTNSALVRKSSQKENQYAFLQIKLLTSLI